MKFIRSIKSLSINAYILYKYVYLSKDITFEEFTGMLESITDSQTIILKSGVYESYKHIAETYDIDIVTAEMFCNPNSKLYYYNDYDPLFIKLWVNGFNISNIPRYCEDKTKLISWYYHHQNSFEHVKVLPLLPEVIDIVTEYIVYPGVNEIWFTDEDKIISIRNMRFRIEFLSEIHLLFRNSPVNTSKIDSSEDQ
jgi:hypothetical protein